MFGAIRILLLVGIGDDVRGDLVRMAVARAGFHILERPGRSAILLLAVATGVALAVAIIAASHGVESKVNGLLNKGPLPPSVNLDDVRHVLSQTRDVLTKLAYAFTAALVWIVTWISMGERRREIGLARQHGFHVSEVVMELLIEAAFLCAVGGLVGVGLGNLLCWVIQGVVTLLPMSPEAQDVLTVFPVVTALSFGATTLVTGYFAVRTELQPKL